MITSVTSAVCSRPPSQPIHTTYGPRLKAEFTLPSGEVVPIFVDSPDPVFSSISKGSTVELVMQKRGWAIGRVGGQWSNPMPTPNSPPPPPQSSQQSEAAAVAERIRRHVSTLAFCLREVQQNKTFESLSEDGQRQMAVTAFIQSQR